VLCVAGAARKFDIRLGIKEKPNNLGPVERKSCNDRVACFRQDLYVFPPTTVASVEGLYTRCEGQLRTLE
jgi:hypothetical protein